MSDFPVDVAQLVALFMEAVTYGIYVVTLALCVRSLFWGRHGLKATVNWPMAAVTALMCVFATLDVALGLRHNLEAFVYYTGPGGPAAEFDNISYWVNVMKVCRSLACFFYWRAHASRRAADGQHTGHVAHRGRDAGASCARVHASADGTDA